MANLASKPAVRQCAVFLFLTLIWTTSVQADPIIIDGTVTETQTLVVGQSLTIEPGGEIDTSAADSTAIEANVGNPITIDDGTINSGDGAAIRTDGHLDLLITNNSRINSTAFNLINFDDLATIRIFDSEVTGRMSGGHFADLVFDNANIHGRVGADTHAHIEATDSTIGDFWVDDSAVIDLINTSVNEQIRMRSRGALSIDENSLVSNGIRAAHQINMDIHGTVNSDSGSGGTIQGDSGHRVHLRGAMVTSVGSLDNGIDLGQGSTVHLSEGAQVDAANSGISLADSSVIFMEGGSLVKSGSSPKVAIRLLRSSNVSIVESALDGRIIGGNATRVSIVDGALGGASRLLDLGRGSIVTISGLQTVIKATSSSAVTLDQGSRLTLLGGTIESSNDFGGRGVDTNDGSVIDIRGGEIVTAGTGSNNHGIDADSASSIWMDNGSISTASNDSSGVRLRNGRLTLQGNASITTSGNEDGGRGSHGLRLRQSIAEIFGGQVDVQGSGNFAAFGIEGALIRIFGGTLTGNTAAGSYSLGSFDGSTIRIYGLEDDFTIEVDGSGDGEQAITIGEGGTVSLGELYPDFNDASEPFSGTIRGTHPDQQSFELTFSNQYQGAIPGAILLRATEPDPDPDTETALFSQTNPSEVEEPVTFTVEVTSPAGAPDDGQVTVFANTGESCSDESEPLVSGNTATFECVITFETVGSRAVSADFSGSQTHFDSSASPITQTVNLALFADRFEAETTAEATGPES